MLSTCCYGPLRLTYVLGDLGGQPRSNPLLRIECCVLVDHRRSQRVVSHSLHEVSSGRTWHAGREGVAGVAQIVEVESVESGLTDDLPPTD